MGPLPPPPQPASLGNVSQSPTSSSSLYLLFSYSIFICLLHCLLLPLYQCDFCQGEDFLCLGHCHFLVPYTLPSTHWVLGNYLLNELSSRTVNPTSPCHIPNTLYPHPMLQPPKDLWRSAAHIHKLSCAIPPSCNSISPFYLYSALLFPSASHWGLNNSIMPSHGAHLLLNHAE